VSTEVTEPWASAMVAAKLVDPRNGRASMRALAERAGTTTSTISKMIAGTRVTSNEVVERVADALGMSERVGEVMSWVDRVRSEAKPFSPHPDANLLTSEEQEAINEMIRLLALSKKAQGGGEREDSSAPIVELFPSKRVDVAARRTGKPTAAQRKAAEDAEKGEDWEPR
jgi:transcriptional regulator with XRE-family HTH domain